MDDAQILNRRHAGIIFISVLFVFALQLPWISRPPFDAHCFRQCQTLSTIELFALEGIDVLHPKTNYVGEPGVFVLELPLFQALCALLYQWFGPHLWLVRLVNLMFTFGNALLTFAIGKRLFNSEAGFASMLIYLFAPLNLVYMASTLIDPSATLCSLSAFVFALRVLHPRDNEGPAGAGTWAAFALACILTALIKTLYLFPICVLVGATFLRRRKLSAPLVAAGGCLMLAATLLLLWLRHSRHVNDTFYFTRGVNPTTLLGFEPLVSSGYYKDIARRLLLHIMGPGGALLAVLAVIAVLKRKDASEHGAAFAIRVLAVSIVGYYLVFSKANAPHDYYSLVVSPYACLMAGFGVVECARRAAMSYTRWRVLLANPKIVTLTAVALSTAVFFKPAILLNRSRLAPAPSLQELQQLSQGRFEPWSFGMVFLPFDSGLPSPVIAHDAPQVLYATGLRGTGSLVPDAQWAITIWKEKRPHYKHLKYVVFYGLNPPEEIVQGTRGVIVADTDRKWFVYRVE
jgi:hypothetical protein